jgi:hypothetical protein
MTSNSLQSTSPKDTSSRLVAVVDVDGTLVDSLPRLRQFAMFRKQIAGGRGVWTQEQVDAFLDAANAAKDKPFPGAVAGMKHLLESDLFEVVMLTGRTELARSYTRRLLIDWFGVPDSVPLLMRAAEDDRPTQECKPDMFLKHVRPHYVGPFVFFEDEDSTLAEYAKHGMALKAPACWKTFVLPS